LKKVALNIGGYENTNAAGLWMGKRCPEGYVEVYVNGEYRCRKLRKRNVQENLRIADRSGKVKEPDKNTSEGVDMNMQVQSGPNKEAGFLYGYLLKSAAEPWWTVPAEAAAPDPAGKKQFEDLIKRSQSQFTLADLLKPSKGVEQSAENYALGIPIDTRRALSQWTHATKTNPYKATKGFSLEAMKNKANPDRILREVAFNKLKTWMEDARKLAATNPEYAAKLKSVRTNQ
jgi:hypothetical protein